MRSFFSPHFDLRKASTGASTGGFHSTEKAPTGDLIVLGDTALMGALTGLLAVEFFPGQQHSRIWTLYEQAEFELPAFMDTNFCRSIFHAKSIMPKTLPYSRVCADAPHGVSYEKPLQYWIDPNDELTQYAGLGTQWLEPLPATPRNGLILAQLNTHMLNHTSVVQLQSAGLLLPLKHTQSNSQTSNWLMKTCS